MKLVNETRWRRIFATQDGSKKLQRSRFQDGSASITLEQLTREWHSWSEDQRNDFVQAVPGISKETRIPVLQFLIRNADPDMLSGLAVAIAKNIPPDESVPWLVQCIKNTKLGGGINYVQALATLRLPDAHTPIKQRLDRALSHHGVFLNHPFMNWIAAEAIYCIKYLIELGQPVEDFGDSRHLFSNHPCFRVRQTFETHLAKYFQEHD